MVNMKATHPEETEMKRDAISFIGAPDMLRSRIYGEPATFAILLRYTEIILLPYFEASMGDPRKWLRGTLRALVADGCIVRLGKKYHRC